MPKRMTWWAITYKGEVSSLEHVNFHREDLIKKFSAAYRKSWWKLEMEGYRCVKVEIRPVGRPCYAD